jgi:hypothetical protein
MEKTEQKLEEEKDGAMLSRDRLLKLDPKKRTGQLTLKGKRIKTKGQEQRAEDEKEN